MNENCVYQWGKDRSVADRYTSHTDLCVQLACHFWSKHRNWQNRSRIGRGGVLFDSDLYWGPQIHQGMRNAAYYLRMLRKVRFLVAEK